MLWSFEQAKKDVNEFVCELHVTGKRHKQHLMKEFGRRRRRELGREFAANKNKHTHTH